MSKFILKSFVAYLVLGLPPTMLEGQVNSACRPADATSTRMVQWLTAVVTGTDSTLVQLRTRMKLPQVAASQITYVTDNRICSKLVAPYNAETVMQDASGSVPPSGKLYVVKVGTVYVASDPIKTTGEYAQYVTLDGKFRVLAASLG